VPTEAPQSTANPTTTRQETSAPSTGAPAPGPVDPATRVPTSAPSSAIRGPTTSPTTNAPTSAPSPAVGVVTTSPSTSGGVRTTDFYIEYRVLSNDEPAEEVVQDLIDFTNDYVTNFLQTEVSEYSVEKFESTLFELDTTPSPLNPPDRDQPATIRITFDTLVIIAADSPLQPKATQVDEDIARAFEVGTSFVK
jgi:hypothetical protein